MVRKESETCKVGKITLTFNSVMQDSMFSYFEDNKIKKKTL